ncbi:hypothetical protein M406DRAFT_334026 [Cryphonectria parasitica EP155]|uniref:SMP-30/Gluconolactonase/LRE-like region domain-containing protein n=1 Tax=Cryphonectria parasitica (strain ATCC 38755 / EP155) TaxID=660469 RepID=A0A9P4XW36_CRYP1|nr:uncharacterized protein M406DRAFT_334026 [Cryphonectria parasitica EP155]KAF3761986.1 hypothetical protein M406DRAFT_334026 [Cryphonectria parasitica EP155]
MTSRLRSFVLLPLTALLATGPAAANCNQFPLNVTALHTFSYPTWLENLAIRSNGEILTTQLAPSPVLYQVNHLTGTPTTVATWDGTEWYGALGIAETTTDVFYVILSAFFDQDDFVKTSGVNSIFEVNMSTFALAEDGVTVEENATVTHLTDIPEADFLNGMATLDDEHIYVGDVYSGVVYLIDTTTGDYQVAVNDTLMKFSVDGSAASTNLGSNGLKVFDGYLYWTNTARGFLARIAVGSDGLPTGESEIVVDNLAKADDFQFRSDGTVFVAQNQQDTLSLAYGATSGTEVTAVPIAGNNISTILAGVSSPKFGRTSNDSNRLYLSTSGALGLPINGTVTVAGTISYVDINF